VTDLGAFSNSYLEVFSKGYNYAFGIAASAMVISLLVYVIFNKLLPNKEKAVKGSASAHEGIKFEFRPLIYALIAMGIFAADCSLSSVLLTVLPSACLPASSHGFLQAPGKMNMHAFLH